MWRVKLADPVFSVLTWTIINAEPSKHLKGLNKVTLHLSAAHIWGLETLHTSSVHVISVNKQHKSALMDTAFIIRQTLYQKLLKYVFSNDSNYPAQQVRSLYWMDSSTGSSVWVRRQRAFMLHLGYADPRTKCFRCITSCNTHPPCSPRTDEETHGVSLPRTEGRSHLSKVIRLTSQWLKQVRRQAVWLWRL